MNKIKYIIISNKAQCEKCEEIIESKYRHDYVTCKCGNLAVDGGKDYIKRGFKEYKWKELSEFKPDIKVVI